jgi:hypothetical protein
MKKFLFIVVLLCHFFSVSHAREALLEEFSRSQRALNLKVKNDFLEKGKPLEGSKFYVFIQNLCHNLNENKLTIDQATQLATRTYSNELRKTEDAAWGTKALSYLRSFLKYIGLNQWAKKRFSEVGDMVEDFEKRREELVQKGFALKDERGEDQETKASNEVEEMLDKKIENTPEKDVSKLLTTMAEGALKVDRDLSKKKDILESVAKQMDEELEEHRDYRREDNSTSCLEAVRELFKNALLDDKHIDLLGEFLMISGLHEYLEEVFASVPAGLRMEGGETGGASASAGSDKGSGRS